MAKARVLSERRPEFGLLETLAHDARTGFRHLEAHLDRLRASARYFGFTYDEGAVRDALDKAVVEVGGPARVRCVLHRDGVCGGRGVAHACGAGRAGPPRRRRAERSTPAIRSCTTRRPSGSATSTRPPDTPAPTTSCW